MNSCPAIDHDPGVAPDQVGVMMSAPAWVTVPKNVTVVIALTVPVNTFPACTHVAPLLVSPVQYTAPSLVLVTLTTTRCPAPW